MKNSILSSLKKQIWVAIFSAATLPVLAQTPTGFELGIGDQNMENILKTKIVSTKLVKFPEYVNGKMETKTIPYKDLEAPYLSSVDESLKYMNDWKKTDNEGFANLVAAISEKIQKDPELSKNFRITTKLGVTGISIGQPNIFIPLNETPINDFSDDQLSNPQIIPIVAAVIVAWTAGYAVGTACVKLGPCNFAK
jgi:hypothetical protein